MQKPKPYEAVRMCIARANYETDQGRIENTAIWLDAGRDLLIFHPIGVLQGRARSAANTAELTGSTIYKAIADAWAERLEQALEVSAPMVADVKHELELVAAMIDQIDREAGHARKRGDMAELSRLQEKKLAWRKEQARITAKKRGEGA